MKQQLLRSFPLSSVCTLQVGGPANFYMEVTNPEEARFALDFAQAEGLPFFVLGKGSNLLFDDRGYKGLVIHNKIQYCQIEESSVSVGGGFSYSLLGIQTAKRGLSGLEFASGIPGTVGGAIYMNAGAMNKETKDYLVEVDFMAEDGRSMTFPRASLEFAYRTSCFQQRKGVILGAKFALQVDQKAKQAQKQMLEKRIRSQPYDKPSAGCFFKNSDTYSAGNLIDQCGLKGLQIGGAQISSLHANFIVNAGGATSKDIESVIEKIKETIKQEKGIELEMEVRKVPYE